MKYKLNKITTEECLNEVLDKIPALNLSLDYGTDNDNEESKQQRLERGFDDTELFNFDMTISKFILPRLKRYIEVCDDNNIDELNNIARALEMHISGDFLSSIDTTFITENIKKLFNIYCGLWL